MVSTLLIKSVSQQAGLIPFKSAYSKPNVPVSGFAFNTAIIPLQLVSTVSVTG